MRGTHVRYSCSDKIYYGIAYTILTLLTLLVLLPMMFVVAASFSSGSAVTAGKVWLWPVNPTLYNYEAVLRYKSVWIGYRNTLFYTVAGTAINLAVTMCCAYPLARKNLKGRGLITGLFTFTMIFSGGMIPSYLLMRDLKIINTVWVMLLPGAMSVYNMIVARTNIQNSIPEELLEASTLDGCNDTQYFFYVVLPLSKAIVSVIALYYSVAHWNGYFSALIYLSKAQYYPLQLVLRNILLLNQGALSMIGDLTEEEIAFASEAAYRTETMKYALIFISSAPLLAAYPFVQKYFVKGVMVGSLKG